MAKARWNDQVIAETDDYEIVEGNVYFPPEAVDERFLEPSSHTSICGWKGTASYYTVVVDGRRNVNAAWTYPTPKADAAHIAGFIAFWNGVEVER